MINKNKGRYGVIHIMLTPGRNWSCLTEFEGSLRYAASIYNKTLKESIRKILQKLWILTSVIFHLRFSNPTDDWATKTMVRELIDKWGYCYTIM